MKSSIVLMGSPKNKNPLDPKYVIEDKSKRVVETEVNCVIVIVVRTNISRIMKIQSIINILFLLLPEYLHRKDVLFS